tara:strand:+ start:50 stop:1336 length:1287 start_codon:yes stop_codon:yes gene_type:complete
MKLFVKILILLPLFNFSQLNLVDPESQGISKDRIQMISDLSKRYVDDGMVANITTMVNRNGKIVYFESFGKRGFDDNKEIKNDDLYRIYSMTKPIVSVAIMQLYEKGKFHLNNPVEKFIPELKNLKIAITKDSLVDAKNKITVKHLLTHTSGLSYGWSRHPADSYYRKAGLFNSKNSDDFINRVSKLPLRFEPGTKYNYSISTDILGILVERISGLSLSDYLNKNVFSPLGMVDTFFEVPRNKAKRFLPNHTYDRSTNEINTIDSGKYEDSKKIEGSTMRNYYDVNMYSGGGGLVSTAYDYMIFAECLRNGGEFNGKRIIGSKTLKYMTKGHLPSSIQGIGRGESPNDPAIAARTFGLGFGIINSPETLGVIGSKGIYSWGGAAGTIFWIDPQEEIVVVSMIQLMQSPWNLRNDLKVATYQSIVDSYE